jgi:hypothetical protein
LAFHANVLGQPADITNRLTAALGWATVNHCGGTGRTENMPNNFNFFALLALMFAISAGMSVPTSAKFLNRPSRVLASDKSASDGSRYTDEFAAQSRPRIIIRPRRIHPGPNSKRQCVSWLAKEYRVSGPVIVPQMRCWWD